APPCEPRRVGGQGRRGADGAGSPGSRGLLRIGLRHRDRRVLPRAAGDRMRPRHRGRIALLHPRPLDHRARDRPGSRRVAGRDPAPAPARSLTAAVRLFLFDIDGTLLSARGAGRLALAQAMSSVYGTSGAIDEYDFRGKTDPRIVLDLMQAAGFREDEVR